MQQPQQNNPWRSCWSGTWEIWVSLPLLVLPLLCSQPATQLALLLKRKGKKIMSGWLSCLVGVQAPWSRAIFPVCPAQPGWPLPSQSLKTQMLISSGCWVAYTHVDRDTEAHAPSAPNVCVSLAEMKLYDEEFRVRCVNKMPKGSPATKTPFQRHR